MLKLFRRPEAITAATSDEALVRRARTGDTHAFRALFHRHVLAVHRFVRDLLRVPQGADDATQETFTRAHLRLDRLADHDRFKPWLLGIARNVVFEINRAHVHEPLDDDDESLPDAIIPSPDPEGALLDRELEAHFFEALGHLPERRRAALLLRLDHGLSYDDIAASFGWSLPTVKNEIHRARLALRAALVGHIGARR